MKIDSLDHVVLTVKDIDATCKFYAKVLRMEIVTFRENRKALSFGSQKINLQQLGRESTLKSGKANTGSADVCFITSISLSDVITHLILCGVNLIGGPVERNGARGPMMSVYFRDPDMNLIEVSKYVNSN
jgi:catechol 2,3-dioxygenase-like lactoylglutathione lyase family enzyme